eukprot:COSAG01_NODE_1000_length_12213_cov_20.853063_13_plen_112_part_00
MPVTGCSKISRRAPSHAPAALGLASAAGTARVPAACLLHAGTAGAGGAAHGMGKLTLAISNKISLDKIYTSWFVLSPIECLLQTSNGQHSNKCLLLRYNYTCLYLCRRVLP